MSRKDTIIIAVLINAGLLMVLFATAISSNDETIVQKPIEKIQPQERNLVQAAPTIKQNTAEPLTNVQLSSSSNPEIDQLLNQFASIPLQAEGAVDEITQNSLSGQSGAVKNQATIIEPTTLAANESIQNGVQEKVVQEKTIQEPAFVNVTVKKGDYLEKIAKANGSSVSDIMKVNKLETTQLKIGQVLKIPTKGASIKSMTTPQHSKEATPSQSEEFYVVKNGDNPWLIASKNQVKLDDLLRINNLDEQKARKLKPGDKIRIR